MSTPTSKRIIQLSMSIRCWRDLVRYGVNETMQREFGDWLSPDGVEEGFNVTLVLDFEKIPEEGRASLPSLGLRTLALRWVADELLPRARPRCAQRPGSTSSQSSRTSSRSRSRRPS